jgi:hypothetical protein
MSAATPRKGGDMNARSAAISIGLCSLLAAAPASAVESLSGTWEGTLKCQTLDSGTTTKTKVDQTVAIEDLGEEGVVLNLQSTKGLFNGFVVADGKKPQNGILSAAGCGFNQPDLEGGVLQLEVKTKAGDVKASLKGDLLLMDLDEDIAESCTLTAKRVSNSVPKLPLCALKTTAR